MTPFSRRKVRSFCSAASKELKLLHQPNVKEAAGGIISVARITDSVSTLSGCKRRVRVEYVCAADRDPCAVEETVAKTHFARDRSSRALIILRVIGCGRGLRDKNAEIIGGLKIQKPSFIDRAGIKIGIFFIEAVDITKVRGEIETLPVPTKPAIAFPSVVAFVRRSWVRRSAREFLGRTTRDALHFKRIEIRDLGQRRKGADGCVEDVLNAEVDTVSCLGRFVPIRNNDARDVAAGETFDALARQQG